MRKLAVVPVLLLVFASCKKEKTGTVKEKEFDLSGFTGVYTGEKINLVIEKGASFHIKTKGPAGNVDRLELKLTANNILDISYLDGATADPVDLTVTLPDLETAYLTGQVTAIIRGFGNQPGMIGFVLSGHANVTANDGATIFGVDLAGNAQLTLNGATANLTAEVSGNGIVNAYGLTATRVYMTTTQQAKAYVKPVNIFYGSAGGDSRIFYKGDPPDKQMETSGNGQIIQE